MDWKKLFIGSTEVWTGGSLVIAILSEILPNAAKTTRERARIRIRRDDD